MNRVHTSRTFVAGAAQGVAAGHLGGLPGAGGALFNGLHSTPSLSSRKALPRVPQAHLPRRRRRRGHRPCATVGRKYTVVFETRNGQKVTKKLTLRAERKGDDAGKPLVY
jgi:hypothetical protein